MKKSLLVSESQWQKKSVLVRFACPVVVLTKTDSLLKFSRIFVCFAGKKFL